MVKSQLFIGAGAGGKKPEPEPVRNTGLLDEISPISCPRVVMHCFAFAQQAQNLLQIKNRE